MKNPPTDQPRFTCRVVRGWLSILGDGSEGAPRGFGAGHFAKCADCQQFFGACDELALALKGDAARERHEPPVRLEQKILRAVKLSQPESRPSQRGARRAWLSLAGACALLALAVFQRQLGVRPAVAPTVAPTEVATLEVSPQQLWDSLKPSTTAALAGDPLQNEVDAVVSDVRSAVRFLERNFLPTAPERQGRSG